MIVREQKNIVSLGWVIGAVMGVVVRIMCESMRQIWVCDCDTAGESDFNE